MNWQKTITRRTVLKLLGGLGLMSVTPSMALGVDPKKKKNDFMDEFFQKNYRIMSKKEKQEAVERLQRRYKKEYGKSVDISTKDAHDGEKFVYLLDISRCIGCRKCVTACAEENNTSRGGETSSQIQYIQVLKFKKGKTMRLEEGDAEYEDIQGPDPDAYYVPIACQQCENAPCVNACPTKATWIEKEGISVVDYNWCIGCRMCVNACPYGARKFNWGKPELPPNELNVNTHYLSNRPRTKGVVEKCHFCLQRVRDGKYPQCHKACPAGVRKFGNLLDPSSEVHYIFKKYKVFRLKENLNTEPRFYYYSSLG